VAKEESAKQWCFLDNAAAGCGPGSSLQDVYKFGDVSSCLVSGDRWLLQHHLCEKSGGRFRFSRERIPPVSIAVSDNYICGGYSDDPVVSCKKQVGRDAVYLFLSLILGGLWEIWQTGYDSEMLWTFLIFYIASCHWPAFNVADSAISVGAVLLIVEMFRKKSGSLRQ